MGRLVKPVDELMSFLIIVFFTATWLMGIVLAPGYHKWFALFPLYSWYLVTEFFMKYYGLIQ